MNDKALAALIKAQILTAARAATSMPALDVARSFQARQQGAATGPCVYFFKLLDKHHGSPKREDLFDTGGQVFGHTEKQLLESPYQFSAWVPQDPRAPTELTESDVLNIVSGIIQSDFVIAAFLAAGVGIQRVTQVTNPYILDDRDRFEAIPTFDVVFTHYRTTTTTLPAVVAYDANISRV